MAKTFSSTPTIYDLQNELKDSELKPVYFIYGQDLFGIDEAVKAIEDKVQPFLASDFDKESYSADTKPVSDLVDFCSTFPFGSDKKLIVYKNFSKAKDKKNLAAYVKNPAEFTVVIITQYVDDFIKDNPAFNSDPYKSMKEKGYVYEAKELKGKALVDWLVSYVSKKGKHINRENAQVFVDLVGENRALIEGQVDKIESYLTTSNEFDYQTIINVTSDLKEFSIFDLQDAILAKSRAKTIYIGYNLIDKGTVLIIILSTLTKFFTNLLRTKELMNRRPPINQQEGAKIIGVHPFVFQKLSGACNKYSEYEFLKISKALYEAEVALKTTASDDKILFTQLVASIF